MYQINRNKKSATLVLMNEKLNTTQTITIDCEVPFLSELFLYQYHSMYSAHAHMVAIRAVNVNRNVTIFDPREEANRTIEWLRDHAYSAIVFGKADEAMITQLMDVANTMFEEIHQYARECVNDWRK